MLSQAPARHLRPTRLSGARARIRAFAPWPEVFASWLAARVVVLAALLLSSYVQQQVELLDGVHLRTVSLLGWDAAWYDRIAATSYDTQDVQALRFFPLVPLLARGLGWVLGGHPGLALLLMANVGAVLYAAGLHRLALLEGLGQAAARRVLWVAALAPAGFVLVMGYTEAVYGLLLVGAFLALRTRRWLVAALFGALAGTSRPTGVLLALPAAIEAFRGLRAAGGRQLVARSLAVLAPAAGLASYLGWNRVHHGDWFRPFTVQARPGLRGGLLVDTRHQVAQALGDLPSQVHPTVLHLPWVAVASTLLVVSARRLPLSFTAFAAVTLALGLTARELSSFERYAGSDVPLLLAAALVCGGRLRAPALLAGGAGLLGMYAVLAFLRLYTP